MEKKITLIVEDSKTQAENIKQLLETSGYHVIHASSTEEALKLLKQTTPNVIISDIMMPGMDGFTFCSKIKTDNRLKGIPVILLTSLSDPSDIIKGLDSGADSFIIKPYNEDELLSKIQYLIQNLNRVQNDSADTGMEIKFLGKNHYITSSRAQIIELLLSTFETAVKKNKELILSNSELKTTQEKLNDLNETLENKVEERTRKIDHINSVLNAIRSVNELIIRETDRSCLIREACRRITKALNLSSAFIALTDNEGKVIDYAEEGLNIESTDFKDSLNNGYLPNCFRKIAESNDILLINDMQNDCGNCPRMKYLNHNDSGIFCMRLKTKNNSYGIINLEIEKKYFNDEQELSLYKELAADIAYALHIMELGENRKKAFNALIISENKLAEQNKEYLRLNKEYLIVNQELIESLDRIKKINTELIRAKEKSEESEKLKSAFLSNMSHEIRTPLNAIVGFAALLMRSDLTKEDIYGFIQVINSSSQQLLSIINDILEISKIETGQIQINKGPVDINSLIKELHIIYEKQIDSDKIRFSYIIDDTKPILLKTDGNRIKQIFCNLLNNAIKFTQAGEIKFGYLVKDKFIELFVSDTGVGIAPEYHSVIFTRFNKVEKTDKHLYGGNGLGLAISKALVEKLGGTITLDSELEKGSTFLFTLPIEEYNSEERIESIIIHKSDKKDWRGKTILIAEDDPINFELYRYLLRKTQAKLVWAKNGQEAVEIIRSDEKISLIIMDIKMPLMDGLTATRLIKNIRKEIPIIAITAFAEEEQRKESILAGCSSYLTKPVRSDTLYTVIEKFI